AAVVLVGNHDLAEGTDGDAAKVAVAGDLRRAKRADGIEAVDRRAGRGEVVARIGIRNPHAAGGGRAAGTDGQRGLVRARSADRAHVLEAGPAVARAADDDGVAGAKLGEEQVAELVEDGFDVAVAGAHRAGVA